MVTPNNFWVCHATVGRNNLNLLLVGKKPVTAFAAIRYNVYNMYVAISTMSWFIIPMMTYFNRLVKLYIIDEQGLFVFSRSAYIFFYLLKKEKCKPEILENCKPVTIVLTCVVPVYYSMSHFNYTTI